MKWSLGEARGTSSDCCGSQEASCIGPQHTRDKLVTKPEQVAWPLYPRLKQQLDAQFREGMSWVNHGEWHVDNIRPCAIFDLTRVAEQKVCFHYTNLQPLWAEENLRKNDKTPSDIAREPDVAGTSNRDRAELLPLAATSAEKGGENGHRYCVKKDEEKMATVATKRARNARRSYHVSTHDKNRRTQRANKSSLMKRERVTRLELAILCF